MLTILYLFNWFVWTGCFIQGLYSQPPGPEDSRGFCKRRPIIRICTAEHLTGEFSVNIDTDHVPRQQTSSCTCTISPSDISAEFLFTYTDESNADNMMFEINNLVLDAEHKGTKTTTLSGPARLSFSTDTGYMANGVCLIVSTVNESKFDITCKASSSQETTESSGPSTSDEKSTSVTEAQRKTEKKTSDGMDIIVPIVAATSGIVCLAAVITVVVVCRRRFNKSKNQPDSQPKDVTKDNDNEDDYYMTNNPMYNIPEPQTKTEKSESEYHYIEPDNRGGRKSSNQYESMPDSPLSKQFPNTQAGQELHYDYTMCNSVDQQNDSVATSKAGGKSVDINTKEAIASRINKPIDGETMYDHTDTTVKNKFLSVNEYHHISPASSQEKVAIDTYDSFKDANASNVSDVHDSDYNVTNLR